MVGDDVLYLPIRELGARIRKRTLSPVGLAESYLERSRRIGPKLNAYATLTTELALQQARAAEKEIAGGHYRGPLHGIPYAAKDLVAVKGYPTTWGAPPFADQKFDYDATVIERLNQAGAVLLGKAAMIELAGGLGYSGRIRVLDGPGAESLESGLLDLRLVQRLGRDCVGGPGALGHWIRYARVHHVPDDLVRHLRYAAQLRARQPIWRHGHRVVDGQARTDGEERRRLRLDSFGDRRA